MKKHKLQPMKEQVCSKSHSMMESIAILMKSKPTALIVCGESLISEFAYSANLLNLRIPEDISVISFEKCDVSRWLTPPHTTVSQDVSALSTAALDSIRSAAGGTLASHEIKFLTNELVIRDSVKKLS
jgi:LacI family transcriptional regulator